MTIPNYYFFNSSTLFKIYITVYVTNKIVPVNLQVLPYKWVFSRKPNFVIFFEIGGIFFSGI